MTAGIKHVEVDPGTASPDFWARYHAYRRARHDEVRPEDPIDPDGVVELKMKRGDPFEIHYFYEVAHGDRMLSWFRSGIVKPGTPEYETNKHLFWVDWSVHRDHRRKGIGRSWIPLAIDLMDRHGCTVFSAGAEENSGHAFLRWLGAEEKMTGAENRLRMADVDWAMVKRWIADGERRSPQTKFEVYDGRLPEDMLEDFCPQLSSMLNTMPWEQMDHGDIVVTPAMMKEWYAQMDLSGELQYNMMTREPDGTISGVTDMVYMPYKPTIIQQLFTGVRPDQRGRGLGKWLKASMLLHVKQLHPGVEWVTTGNAGSNAPMLGINKELGFKQFVAGSEYQISRDRLAARAKELAAARR
jgi:mycothiol synthase